MQSRGSSGGWNLRIQEPKGLPTPKRVEQEYNHQWLKALFKRPIQGVEILEYESPRRCLGLK